MGKSNQSINACSLHGASYNIFILVLTVISLIIVTILFLPFVRQEIKETLLFIDTIICILFFADFANNLWRSPSRKGYVIYGGGWLDLLGSVPAFPAVPWTAILRLARLPRIGKIVRDSRSSNRQAIRKDLRANRAQSALLATILVAIMVLTISATVVLRVENLRGLDPNIQSSGDALWWAFVTITTVGYGDRFPTTGLGRVMAIILMTIGVGLFGVLTSYLATAFTASQEEADLSAEDQPLSAVDDDEVLAQMKSIKEELATINTTIQRIESRIQEIGPGDRG